MRPITALFLSEAGNASTIKIVVNQLGPMRYAHDLFISYAHLDNQPLVAGEEGWVSNLHKLLKIRLSQLIGQKLKIWRDKKLGGNEVLESSLKRAGDEFGRDLVHHHAALFAVGLVPTGT
jgi:hypothetical protein